MTRTHGYDFLMKLATLLGIIVLLVQIPFFEENGIAAVAVALVLYVLVYRYLTRTIGSYLYCRQVLKMNIRLREAAALNDALAPMWTMDRKWLPLKEVATLPEDAKYQTALDLKERWEQAKQERRRENAEKFKSSAPKTKVLTILMYLCMGCAFVAGILNIPPASWISQLYQPIFGTNAYYPILDGLILIIPILILFKLIDKNIN